MTAAERAASEQIEPDTKRLEGQLDGIQRRLRLIVEQDRLAELIPIWRRPGWTTPAELFLVGEALAGIDVHVQELERRIDAAVQGADLVGR